MGWVKQFGRKLPLPDNMPPFPSGWTISGGSAWFTSGSGTYIEIRCLMESWQGSDTGWSSAYSPEITRGGAHSISFGGQYEGGGNYNFIITVQGYSNGSWVDIDNITVTGANNVGNWSGYTKTVAISGYSKIRFHVQTRATRGNRESAGGNLRITSATFA